MKQKRIGYMIPTLNRAGTEVKCLTLCEGISNTREWESVVFYRDYGKGEVERWALNLSPDGLRPLSPRLKKIRSNLQILRCSDVDTLFVNFFGSHALRIALSAKLAGVKTVICCVGSVYDDKNISWFEKTNLRLHLITARLASVRYVAASHSINDSFKAHRVRLSPVSVIHNGCDVDKINFIAKETRKLRKCSRVFRYIMVARVEKSKDFESLIVAFAKVKKMVADVSVELHIVGDGPEKEYLRGQCWRFGVSEEVIFSGFHENIPEALGKADCFVFSAKPIEGFGIVLIEALAAEIPIIASDVPACREVLRDGAFGTFFEAGNSDDLAHKMVLATAIAKKKKSGVPELSEIRELYGIEKMVQQYIKFF